MANSSSQRTAIEEVQQTDGGPPSKEAVLGLQADGSVRCNRESDYCFRFLEGLNWARPLKRTTSSLPWITEEEWARKSFAAKFMRYELAESSPYQDLNSGGPLLHGYIKDLRKDESRSHKQKREDKDSIGDLTVSHQSVTEVKGADDVGDAADEEGDGDFLDEYGNVREADDNTASTMDNMLTLDSARDEDDPRKVPGGSEPGPGKNGRSRTQGPLAPPGTSGRHHLKRGGRRDPAAGASGNPVSHGVRLFRFEEPRPSFLSFKEQRMFLDLMKKFRTVVGGGWQPAAAAAAGRAKTMTTTKEEQLRYQSYLEVVKAEQAEFQAFAEEVFGARQEQLRHLHQQQQGDDDDDPGSKPEAAKYIEEYYDTRKGRVRRDLARHYVPAGKPELFVRLVPNHQPDGGLAAGGDGRSPQFELRLDRTVLEMGRVLKALVPPFWTFLQAHLRDADGGTPQGLPPRVPTSYHKLFIKKPSTDLRGPVGEDPQAAVPPALPRSGISGTCGVSQDPNVRKLAEKLAPDVVASTSSLKALFDNLRPNLTKEWEMPFSVVILGGKKILMLDKPLPQKRMDAREKIEWCHKLAAKVYLLHPWPQQQSGKVVPSEAPGAAAGRVEPQDDNLNVFDEDLGVDLSAIETFGGNRQGAEPTAPKIAQLDGGHSPGSSSSDEECGMKIDEDEPETGPGLGKQVERGAASASTSIPSPDKTDSSSSPARDAAQRNPGRVQRGPEPPKGKRKIRGKSRKPGQALGGGGHCQEAGGGVGHREEDLRQGFQYQGEYFEVAESGQLTDYSKPDGQGRHNVSYRIWHLQEEPTSNCSTGKGGGNGSAGKPPRLEVLVRSSTHGVRNEGQGRVQVYTVSSKMERQTQFGAEKMTPSELAKEWMATLLRPGSQCLRLRVDPTTSSIVTVETKTLKALAEDGIECGFRPAEALGNLHTVFAGLLEKLPAREDQYLMQHDSKTSAFVRVLRRRRPSDPETAAPGTYDLHRAYDPAPESSEAVKVPQWVPIDVGLITPWHQANNRVPGLFAPRVVAAAVGSGATANRKHHQMLKS